MNQRDHDPLKDCRSPAKSISNILRAFATLVDEVDHLVATNPELSDGISAVHDSVTRHLVGRRDLEEDADMAEEMSKHDRPIL